MAPRHIEHGTIYNLTKKIQPGQSHAAGLHSLVIISWRARAITSRIEAERTVFK
jgi:hypothetical protein